MKVFLPTLLAVIAACTASDKTAPNQWALLAAGSSTWENYRHQADICHAYQILIRRGVPASNIVVLMYDDIANDPQNPTPGKLFNKPNGTDVYKGVKIDYKGYHATPENFLASLFGNKEAVKGKGNGRVIESGPNDNIFVYFAGFGDPGIFYFPKNVLHVSDLFVTLKRMTEHKKYGKLLFFVAADAAGNNFDGILPENTNILVSTATALNEWSYAYYCGVPSYPCLADWYSVQWMEPLDEKIPANENLFDQFQKVRHLTTLSHAQLYGDYRVGFSGIKDFIGPNNTAADDNETNDSDISTVSNRDASMQYFKRMAKEGRNQLERLQYSKMAAELEKKQEFVDRIINTIVEKVAENDRNLINKIGNTHKRFTEESLKCIKDVYKHFFNKCFKSNENQYILKHTYKFANICHMGADYQGIAINAIDAVCPDDFSVRTNII